MFNLVFLFALAPLVGCTGKDNRVSKLTIHLPSVEDLSSKVSTSSVGLNQACFAVNIAGSEIPITNAATTCDLPFGVFAGFAVPGAELSLDVPRGTKRSLEVFAYFRENASSPCPTLTNGFTTLNRARIARVGRVESFDIMNEEVAVEVSISTPPAGTSLLTQYSLPASCAATANGSNFAKISPAMAMGTASNGYKFKIRVTDQSGFSTTTGGYKFKSRWGTGN